MIEYFLAPFIRACFVPCLGGEGGHAAQWVRGGWRRTAAAGAAANGRNCRLFASDPPTHRKRQRITQKVDHTFHPITSLDTV